VPARLPARRIRATGFLLWHLVADEWTELDRFGFAAPNDLVPR